MPTRPRQIPQHEILPVPASQVEPGMVTLWGVVTDVDSDTDSGTGTIYTYMLPGNNFLVAAANDPVTVLARLRPDTLEQVRQLGSPTDALRHMEQRIAAQQDDLPGRIARQYINAPAHGRGSLPHGFRQAACNDHCNNLGCPNQDRHDRCTAQCLIDGVELLLADPVWRGELTYFGVLPLPTEPEPAGGEHG